LTQRFAKLSGAWEEKLMQEGDKVTFNFAKGTKEGTVIKVFEKTVLIKADFPKHKGKIVRRKIHQLEK